jgi:CBS domain-containing protein
MRIARFVRAKDAHVAPGDTLHNAAARMRTSGLSSLPVVAGATLVALITERDLVQAMAICDRPGAARVADYMKNGSVAVRPDDEASTALLKMLAIGCLDLPVVVDNRLIGMVSARELLAVQAQLYGVAV